jgi:hypothetical protein
VTPSKFHIGSTVTIDRMKGEWLVLDVLRTPGSPIVRYLVTPRFDEVIDADLQAVSPSEPRFELEVPETIMHYHFDTTPILLSELREQIDSIDPKEE